MSLLALWNSAPDQIAKYAVWQIVNFAGDGKLLDGSTCSQELRTFLGSIEDSALLKRYANECLDHAFDGGGFVLQDVVNEIGRRLDYDVTGGLYRGKSNAVGFDGVWRSDDALDLVVEVKTTDTYNVRLDQIAGYRNKLVEAGEISAESAVLFVVGRQDTGSLEAQIRGSSHAWTMRVIGVESLIRLLQIQEKTTADDTVTKIRRILKPVEYTRLDDIVDIVFDTASDIESQVSADADDDLSANQSSQATLVGHPSSASSLQTRAVSALSHKFDIHLLKKRRVYYASKDNSFGACFVSSKRYPGSEAYWYAYHPHQDELLGSVIKGYFVLSCLDQDKIYAVPLEVMRENLPHLNQTIRDGRHYWHVKGRWKDDHFHLVLPKIGSEVSLKDHEIVLAS